MTSLALPLTQSEAPMPWVMTDDKMRTHPKILAAGPLASWQFFAGLGYCSEYLTDGFIPDSALAALVPSQGARVTSRLTSILLAVGLWTREEGKGGYRVHDYLTYQLSADQVKARREAARLRKEAWLERKRNAVPNASGTQKERTPLPLPLPLPKKPRNKEEKQGRPHVVLSDDQFLKFWSAYPKKVGKDEAARAWVKRGCEAAAGEILSALERQREYLLREEGKYIPNPATWLNQGRWKDDPPRPVPATSDPYAKFPRSAP